MSLIIETMEGIKKEKVPIWMMRQAGRYLPEYKKVRSNFSSFIELCLNPKSASEVTIQPLNRFNLDAAIIFSDILILPHALGIKVDFQKEIGPILEKFNGIEKLKINYKVLEKVNDALKITRERLEKEFYDKALIGFAGAPWTVACYIVEGKKNKDFSNVRKFYYSNKRSFNSLIQLLIEETSRYLIGQIKSGAQIVKIFDSWAGVLTPELFERFVIEPTKEIVKNVKLEYSNIPIIGFAKGAGIMLKEYASKTGINCLAIDYSTSVTWINSNLNTNIVVQGNLDNALLFSNKDDIEEGALKILETFSDRPFVFNLGHGILPDTSIESVSQLVNIVKDYRRCI